MGYTEYIPAYASPASAGSESASWRTAGLRKLVRNMYKRMLKYMGKRPVYNALVHGVIGIGVGFLLAYSVVGIHPVRWGVAFIVLGLLGHLKAMMSK